MRARATERTGSASILRSTSSSAHKEIHRVARQASMAGVLASTGAILSIFTDGLAAPIGIPVILGAISAEAVYTARPQLDLACDVASIYGVPFDPEDAGELATLFALALEVEMRHVTRRHGPPTGHRDPVDGLMASLLQLEAGEAATRVGRKLLEHAILRNVIPVVGIAVSARWNYVATRKVGDTARKYARMRRAVGAAMKKLRLDRIADPARLIEGAWLVATVDGEASHDELIAIAALLEALTPLQQSAISIDETFGDDERCQPTRRRKRRLAMSIVGSVASTR